MALLNARSITQKTFLLNDFFTTNNLDFFCVTETWQRAEDFTALIEMCPPSCTFMSTSRPVGSNVGGGLAVIYRDCFSSRTVSCDTYRSFELLITKIGRLNPFYCIVIYRPPGFSNSFLSDFSDLLTSIITFERFVLLGDFNFHINNSTDIPAINFLNLTESFNLVQHVTGPTHNRGNTLDLVFSFGVDISNIIIEDHAMTDHKSLVFNIGFSPDCVAGTRIKRSRIINAQSAGKFSAAFTNSTIQLPPNGSDDIDVLVHSFNSHCIDILDVVAPYKSCSVRTLNKTPWLNEDTHHLKRLCRKAERQWKSTKLEAHRLFLKSLLIDFNSMVKNARATYFAKLIASSKRNPKVLFETINNIVCPQKPNNHVFSANDCKNFLQFFVDKVATIRAGIVPSTHNYQLDSTNQQSILDELAPISLHQLTKLVSCMKISSSPLDVLPTTILKDVFSSIGPSLLTIINLSLVSGHVPSYFKTATVQPLLKKAGLDPTLPSSYRPISKLPFISKILERIVAEQLLTVLNEHNILDKFQSGFRKMHSTETALLRVTNDLMMAADTGKCSILVLLDLSAAFDTVHYATLINRLRDRVGVTGKALDWFTSYLSDRMFSVSVGSHSSNYVPLSSGVPQGSVLGPTLFALYMLPLGHLISSFKNISYHFYADDIQLYYSFNTNTVFNFDVLFECISAIKAWMADYFYNEIAQKQEVLVVAPEKIIPKVVDCMGPLKQNVRPNIRNLGVNFKPSHAL